MSAIYMKEIKAYFHSIFGWLFLSAFTFFSGLYFILYNVIDGYPYISSTIASLIVIVLFILPLLTMRIFADEKRQKTDQLLLTAPIHPILIVLGKFLALATIMLIACLILGSGVVVMACFGSIPILEALLALFGFFMFGCICISIGMFLSSITEHQFVAAILTYGAFIFMMLVPSFCSYLFSSTSWICKITGALDVITPLQSMFSGIINYNDLIYVFSAVALFLLLSYHMVGKNSFNVITRGKKRVIGSTIGTFIIIAVIIVGNIAADNIKAEVDLTKKSLYSLTDTTKNLLDGLEEDITIYLLAEEDKGDATIQKYLEMYDAASKHVKLEYRSLNQYPLFATAYTDSQMESSSIIIEMGEDYRIVNYADCYITEVSYDYNNMTSSQNVTGIDVEGRVTSAIGTLLNDEEYVIYVVEGHNEVGLSNSLIERMQKNGFTVTNINLLNYDAIPQDAVGIVIPGPAIDLSVEDAKKIEDYLNAGGSGIFVTAQPDLTTPNYDALLEQYGFTFANGIVLEQNPDYYYNNQPYQILPDTNYDDITASVYGKRYNYCVWSRGMVIDSAADENIAIVDLMTTSESAYAKVLTTESTTIEKEEGDQEGPFSLGLYAERQTENGVSRVAVFASNFFLVPEYDQMVSGANSDVFIGALNQTAQVTLSTSVAAKDLSYERVIISNLAATIFEVVTLLVLPIGMLVAGITIWVVRRKR